MNIYVNGSLHHKNKIGISLLSKFGINFHWKYDKNFKYDQIQIFDKTLEIEEQGCPKIYGPHFYGFNREFNLGVREFYRTLTPPQDKLVKSVMPELPTYCFPFAVDVDKFIPQEKTGKPVAYFKSRNPDLFNEVLKTLNKDFIVFNYHTRYNESDYIQAMSKAPYCVWVGMHESQGFAFQEALSCNTPIFVVDLKSLRDEPDFIKAGYGNLLNHSSELSTTTATYFDDTCGLITYEESWKQDIIKFMDNLDSYHPRDYIVSNLSAKVLAQRLIKENEQLH